MKHILIIAVCSAIILALSIIFLSDKLGASKTYEVKVLHPSIWTNNTVNLRDHMMSLGMNKELADKIINECKMRAPISARHCVLIATAISNAESNLGRNAYHGNVFGSKAHSGTEMDAVVRFVSVYAVHYYKPSYDPSDFYQAHGIPRTHYCTDEVSSGSSHGCPNGVKQSWKAWNQLKDIP